MAVLSTKALRQRTAAALASVAGFTASPLVWDNFARTAGSALHRGFAVGVPSSVWTQNGRQRSTVGSLDETTIAVRYARKLRIKDQNASFDEGLDDERSLIKAVTGMSRADLTGLVYVNTPRREVLDDGEWLVVDVNFAAQHPNGLE